MKLVTHIATALVASAIIAVLLDANCDYITMVMYGVAVYASQYMLDAVGHTWVTYRGHRYPKRNRLHSLPGVIGLGLAWGAPFAIRGCYSLVAGIVAGMLLHYVEDAVTESGVYIGKKRVKLPVRISYDNPFANMAAISLTLAAGLAVLSAKWSSLNGPKMMYYLASLMYAFLALFAL